MNHISINRPRIWFAYLLLFVSFLLFKIPVEAADATAFGWKFSGLNTEIRSLAFSEDSQTVYAGTSDGLYKSEDGGQNWVQIFSDDSAEIRTIAVSPKTPEKLYVGVLFASSEETEGLFTSADGGQTWSKIETGLGINFFMDITIDPKDEQIIYAGTGWGIIKSEDAGLTWHAIFSQLVGETGDLPWVHKIIIDPNDSNTIYALTNSYLIYIKPWITPPPLRNGIPERANAVNNVTSGLFKTSNAGLSWERLPLKHESEFLIPHDMVMMPDNTQVFYIATLLGIYKTEDGGNTFQRIFGDQIKYSDTRSLAINPENGAVYAGLSSEGVFLSSNQGHNWKQIFNYGPESNRSASVYDILLPQNEDHRMYVGFGTGVFYKDLKENLRLIDFDENGIVAFQDFLLFAQYYGQSVGLMTIEKRFDLNDNGKIDFADFLLFAQDFTK